MNKQRFKRFCALAAALAMLLGGASAEPAGNPDGALTADFTAQASINLDADLVVGYTAQYNASINPLYCNERDLVSLNELVFESVVGLDDNMQPTPLLADSWTVEDKTWTFMLRSGVSFHNGAPLTAADVVVSYQSFLAAGASNPYNTRLSMIEDMQAVDETTLTVTARYGGYVTLYAMTFPVLQSSTISDVLPRGTGPFWYTQYEVNAGLRLEQNPLWWRTDPKLASVAARWYNDTGSELEALQTNAVDLICTQSSYAALSRKLSNLTSMDYITNTYELLVPCLNAASVMSEPNMRKAVMYAIDRATLVSNAYLGMGIQCEVPVNPNSWLYESQSAIFYYSPERALQLIQELGWADLTGDGMLNKLNGVRLEDLTINIITYNEPTNSIRANAANMIAAYLKSVGVNATVEVLSQARLLERIKARSFDLALIGVNLSEVPNLSQLLHSSGALNLNGYGNDNMDNMIAGTSTATTEEDLKAVYSEIQLTVVDRLPILGLLFRTGSVLADRSLAGLGGIRAGDMLNGIEFMERQE